MTPSVRCQTGKRGKYPKKPRDPKVHVLRFNDGEFGLTTKEERTSRQVNLSFYSDFGPPLFGFNFAVSKTERITLKNNFTVTRNPEVREKISARLKDKVMTRVENSVSLFSKPIILKDGTAYWGRLNRALLPHGMGIKKVGSEFVIGFFSKGIEGFVVKTSSPLESVAIFGWR
jgi:hypothetical protein